MENRTTKYIAAFGLLLGFIIWLCAPVFAYEYNELQYTIFYNNVDWTSGTSNTKYLQWTGTTSTQYVNITDCNTVGYDISTLVPYYADGDHVSLFLSFGISLPRVSFQGSNNTWGGNYRVFISPTNSLNEITYSQGMPYSMLFDLRDIVANNYYAKSYTGSCSWQNVTGSYKALIYHGGDSAIYGTGMNEMENFLINIQLDLNLVQGSELKPFTLGIWRYSDAVGYMPTFRVDTRPNFWLNDTSMYGLLQEIKTALDALDFSALADLGQLSTQISNIYNSVSLQTGVLESMLDDGETDAEPAQWNSQAQEMQSQVADLHSVEESLWGTVEDFEFPTGGTLREEDEAYFGIWFVNPIITPLVLTCLALMIAFLIL